MNTPFLKGESSSRTTVLNRRSAITRGSVYERAAALVDLVFGGIVNAGNALLEGSDLAENDYLLFNFNDYPNAMVTTFNLVVMGNWQAWMQTYWDLTRTSWSLMYFVSFYLITVMLILNLIIAFVLEAFFSELELEESEEEPEARKDNRKKYHRRYTGHKSRSQRVDILLHRILSSELDKSETCEASGASEA